MEDKIDKLTELVEKFRDETREELSALNRGVYGDPKNKRLGLMDIVRQHGIEILKFKTMGKRAVWISSGVAGTVSVIYWLVKEFIL